MQMIRGKDEFKWNEAQSEKVIFVSRTEKPVDASSKERSIRKSAFAGRPVGSSYAHFPLFSTPSSWFRRATRLGRPPINGTRFLVLFAFIGAHIPWTAELLEKPIITKRAISPSMNCNCLLRTIFVSLNLRCVPKRDTYTTTKN